MCGVDVGSDAAPPMPPDATVIDGWELGRRLTSTSNTRERFLARREMDGRQAVLTLYRAGAEPDPSVYEVIRRLPRDHVPEIIATGRWEGQAYEIAEELTGGTLADLGHVSGSVETIRRITDELGRALNAFSEAGLRHRDLRPGTILVRAREPLDLVIAGFGSARLAEYDLDIVSPLETNRYMAPETIAGGVAAASDWWSLGMLLLEQVTSGACFEGVSDQAFLIHVLARGVPIPADLDPALTLLLRGLLTADRRERWQWNQVKEWLEGKTPTAAAPIMETESEASASITLSGRPFRKATAFALAAAEADHWQEASDLLQRGVIATWAAEAKLGSVVEAGIRLIHHLTDVPDDLRLSLALKVLNPAIPLVSRGVIITPGWLLEHPAEGYQLITGPVPEFLKRLDAEPWLVSLNVRAGAVRERAHHLGITLDEEAIQVHLLATSHARLAALWEQRRRILPDTDHPGLVSLIERRQTTAEDLILLLGATVGQFRSAGEIIDDAAKIAERGGLGIFDREAAKARLANPRREIYRELDERLSGFARCGIERIDEWADQFRLERRMPLPRALVALGVPSDEWKEPPRQEYISTLLDFFAKKVSGAILRGPLARMTIGKWTPRVSLTELGSARQPAPAILDQLLARSDQMISIDPSVFVGPETLERRMRSLYSQANLYRRDTGIDGLYLGFPFLLMRDPRGNTRPRIAPILLWPLRIDPEVGNRGHIAVGFDSKREEIRLNPAFEGMIGLEAAQRWQEAMKDLLSRTTVTAAQTMDAFSLLATPLGTTLVNLPGRDVQVETGRPEIACAAVLFHAAYSGQAIAEDLRTLKGRPPAGTALETALRLGVESPVAEMPSASRESERYFMVDSDPSQELAVLRARSKPGLLIEGPPGTGKSQTIVNMVADAIARRKSLLIVCQKQPALEVVRKRLAAEGLDRRIVMLTDVNRDREGTIRQIREQVEALLERPEGGTPEWRRNRERTAVRIEALEGELDRFNVALHRRDDTTGLSYRSVLGELISLEDGPRPPVDARSLRSVLGDLDQTRLAEIEERCAPLVRYWLAAKVEDSPLRVLRLFNPDAATVANCLKSFERFVTAEVSRKAVIKGTSQAFPLDDPAPYRSWIDQFGSLFGALDDHGWADLRRWATLFRATPGAASAGAGLLRELDSIAEAARPLFDDAYDAKLSAAATAIDGPRLPNLVSAAARTAVPASALARLNPWRWFKRRKLDRFVVAAGVERRATSPRRVAAVLDLELAFRPLRKRLAAVHTVLFDGGALASDALSPAAFRAVVDETRQSIASVDKLVRALASYPLVRPAEAVMEAGTQEAFADLMESAMQSFARHDARDESRSALLGLKELFTDEWLAARQARVDADASNSGAIAELHQGLPTLVPYQQFRLRSAELGEYEREILRRLRASETALLEIPPTELEAETRRLIAREARLEWKARMEARDPILLLDAEELRSKVAALERANAEMRRFNRQMVVEDIDPRLLRPRQEWESVTRLTGRRARRLREFVDAGVDLGLLAVRPVWLMNPDVASRVLPLRRMFDSVIFDEASQMPVEHALPALYRAEVLVVSGDEKQMPPTSFFSSKVENDEADLLDEDEPEEGATEAERDALTDTWNRREIKDCPDLLHLAREVLPKAMLEIHYRSSYRELIDFSNASFYANRLNVPVQHPKDKIREARPIEFVSVGGLYDNQTNQDEAKRIAAILRSTWQTQGERPSIGIVTFNRKQADLISEVLEETAETDTAFRQTLASERERTDHGEDMSFFIKNVENVQGDERDIIIFSTTFGRNAAGAFRRFFGVLGQSGGERRLNVAVTRARRKVIVVSSMPIEQISDMLTTHRAAMTPRDYLQAYLEYARAVSAGEFENVDALLSRVAGGQQVANGHATEHDGFGRAVASFVEGLGWPARSVEGGGAFGMDLAITDPGTGLYGIGIECDAPRHRMLAQARAREIWRPRVLAGTFPRLHRVSSKGWYHDREKEQRDLKEAIEQALGERELP